MWQWWALAWQFDVDMEFRETALHILYKHFLDLDLLNQDLQRIHFHFSWILPNLSVCLYKIYEDLRTRPQGWVKSDLDASSVLGRRGSCVTKHWQSDCLPCVTGQEITSKVREFNKIWCQTSNSYILSFYFVRSFTDCIIRASLAIERLE